MLLYHLGQHHLEEVDPYLTRMETECITTLLVEEARRDDGTSTPLPAQAWSARG
jgi:hypothetical protein